MVSSTGMQGLVDELRERTARVWRGGSEVARQRHRDRGKLLARERIEYREIAARGEVPADFVRVRDNRVRNRLANAPPGALIIGEEEGAVTPDRIKKPYNTIGRYVKVTVCGPGER